MARKMERVALCDSWWSMLQGDCACGTSERVALTCELPVILFLELTSACNNRCAGCSNVFAQASFPVPPLTSGQWIAMIEQMVSHVRCFKLTGGEPTLYPEFEMVAGCINDLGIPFTLITNGRWRTPDRLLALFRSMDAVALLVSLHGPDAPSHEAFSGVLGSFVETVANIRRAAKADLCVSTSTVLTRHNWNRIEEMVAFSQSLGAANVVFNRYIGPSFPVLEATPMQVGQAVQRIGELIDLGEPVRWGTPVPFCSVSHATGGCLAGEAFATVDPWGNLRPCNHAPYVTGSLLTHTIEDVWHSPRMEAWRTLVPAECKGCAAYENCHGGCRAEAMLRPALSYSLPRSPYQVSPILGGTVVPWTSGALR